MEQLSKEYGWLPSAIRKEDYADIDKYLTIINVKRKIERDEEMKLESKLKQ